MVNIPDGYAAILRDLDRLEKWVDRNLTELHNLWMNNYRHQYTLAVMQLKSSSAERIW